METANIFTTQMITNKLARFFQYKVCYYLNGQALGALVWPKRSAMRNFIGIIRLLWKTVSHLNYPLLSVKQSTLLSLTAKKPSDILFTLLIRTHKYREWVFDRFLWLRQNVLYWRYLSRTCGVLVTLSVFPFE